MRQNLTRIALFASGSGTNAQKIAEYFQDHPQIEVALILSNNPQAGVLARAKNLGLPSQVFKRSAFYKSQEVLALLQAQEIDWIVLAGFLWLVPPYLIKAFPNRIMNIHPALLPKYGGKGMYGMHVHEAVYQAQEKETGITIHYVNEKYDDGAIIFQAKCTIAPQDKPENIAQKVRLLEHKYFPKVIEDLLTKST